MFMRWIWRGIAVFLARKAWEAFQRHQAAQRSPGPRSTGQPPPTSIPPSQPTARVERP